MNLSYPLHEIMMERLFSIASALMAAAVPLLARGPGRPPLDDTPETALMSPRRRAIVEYVRANPGVAVSKLSDDLQIPAGVLYHHLRMLARAGLIETRDTPGQGNGRLIFLAGHMQEPEGGPLVSATARQVATKIVEEPGLTSAELAERLGMSQRWVRIQLLRLIEAGLLIRERGGSTRYRPAPELTERLGLGR